VGSAIARELSQYELNCVLVEAKLDVGMGTSKANTALWVTGFDAKPDSLESKLLQRSYPILDKFISESGIPVEKIGGLLVAWTDEQYQELPHLLEVSAQNGASDTRLIQKKELYELEPNLKPGALGGMLIPREGIFCPFTLPLAFATQAVLNKTVLKLNFPVKKIARKNGITSLQGPSASIRCRYLINAAGLFSDELNRQLGHNEFTVTPRKGELIVFDKFARSLVNHIILAVPTAISKGILVSPTVYGNVLLGPTAEDIEDKTDTATTPNGLNFLKEKGEALFPRLMQEEVIATYAGLRAATEHSDFQIHFHKDQQYICVGGIRSTGVSASMGIAAHVRDLLADGGLILKEKNDFLPVNMPNIGIKTARPYQRLEMISKNPDYGQIVCHCEKVTLGEIIDATRSPIPATTLDGLRRRTCTMLGRCQGFNCHAEVVRVLSKETGQSPHQLLALETCHEE
jgi:glycerol-3-phosphate dehydrogenase